MATWPLSFNCFNTKLAGSCVGLHILIFVEIPRLLFLQVNTLTDRNNKQCEGAVKFLFNIWCVISQAFQLTVHSPVQIRVAIWLIAVQPLIGRLSQITPTQCIMETYSPLHQVQFIFFHSFCANTYINYRQFSYTQLCTDICSIYLSEILNLSQNLQFKL